MDGWTDSGQMDGRVDRQMGGSKYQMATSKSKHRVLQSEGMMSS